jgi:hypothetical protein
MITIRIASPNDVKLIQEIAYQTWPDVRGNSFCFPAGLYLKSLSKRGIIDNMVHNGHHFILAFEELFVLICFVSA